MFQSLPLYRNQVRSLLTHSPLKGCCTWILSQLNTEYFLNISSSLLWKVGPAWQAAPCNASRRTRSLGGEFLIFNNLDLICCEKQSFNTDPGWGRAGPRHHCEECQRKQGRCHWKVHQGFLPFAVLECPYNRIWVCMYIYLTTKVIFQRCVQNVTTTFVTAAASDFSKSWNSND